MIDGKPDYTRLSTLAMSDVVLLGESDRLTFINALCDMYENIGNDEYAPEKLDGFIGRAIERQFAEHRKGISVYLGNVNRNLSGGKNSAPIPVGNPVPTPVGDPLGNPVPPPTRTRTEREQEVEQEQEQNKSLLLSDEYGKLIKAGYSESEITEAENSVKDWNGIHNKTGYIRGVINKQRSSHTVTAQEYEQREYDDQTESPEKMLARLQMDMGIGGGG